LLALGAVRQLQQAFRQLRTDWSKDKDKPRPSHNRRGARATGQPQHDCLVFSASRLLLAPLHRHLYATAFFAVPPTSTSASALHSPLRLPVAATGAAPAPVTGGGVCSWQGTSEASYRSTRRSESILRGQPMRTNWQARHAERAYPIAMPMPISAIGAAGVGLNFAI
jgi:hypothetical protein